MAKQPIAPTLTISMPASPGPRTRERLNCVALSASPAEILSCGTIDGTIVWNDGIDKASVMPTTSEMATTIHGWTVPASSNRPARRTEHLDRLEPRDHQATVGAIGEDTSGDRQQPDRRAEREGVEADDEGRSTKAQQQPGLRDLLGAGADVRQQACDAEGAEARGPQELNRLPESCRRHAAGD